MTYEQFGAPVKSTEVALAPVEELVQSRESHKILERATMRLTTTLPAVRVASCDARDPMLAATTLASQLGRDHLGCVLFFCSAEYDLGRLGIAMQHVFTGVQVTGCTSAGEITSDG